MNNFIKKKKKELSWLPSLFSTAVWSSAPDPCSVMYCGMGPRIQEVTPVVSMATLRSALRGRRPLLKHKEPRGLDQHKQPGFHTHACTHTYKHKCGQAHKNINCIQLTKGLPV